MQAALAAAVAAAVAVTSAVADPQPQVWEAPTKVYRDHLSKLTKMAELFDDFRKLEEGVGLVS